MTEPSIEREIEIDYEGKPGHVYEVTLADWSLLLVLVLAAFVIIWTIVDHWSVFLFSMQQISGWRPY